MYCQHDSPPHEQTFGRLIAINRTNILSGYSIPEKQGKVETVAPRTAMLLIVSQYIVPDITAIIDKPIA